MATAVMRSLSSTVWRRARARTPSWSSTRLASSTSDQSAGAAGGDDGDSADCVDAALRATLARVEAGVRAREVEGVEGVRTEGPKFLLRFTCSHAACSLTDESQRVVTKVVSQKAYKDGIVLVHCTCDKLHLIADRLGWFGDGPTDIETIMAERGEAVVRQLQRDGTLEID